MGQIILVVFGVGHDNFAECGLLADMHFHQRSRPVYQTATEFGKAHIAPTCDQKVG